ncbi:glycosyltransferase [Candidatus Hydrogenedentota bacterium]
MAETDTRDVKRWEKLLKRERNSLEANVGMGLHCLDSGDPGKALDHFMSALTASPKSPEVRALVGSAHLAAGNLENASSYLKGALEIDPDCYPALCKLGAFYQRMGNDDAAIEVLERAAGLNSGSGEAENDLAVMAHALGDADRAIRYLERSLEKDPDNPDALFNMGTLLQSRERYHEAIGVFERIIESEPETAQNYQFIAAAYENLGHNESASRYYEQAIERDPADTESLCGLGRCKYLLNDLSGAVKAFRGCLEQDSCNAGAAAGLSACLAKEGRADEIVGMWDGILSESCSISSRPQRSRPVVALRAPSAHFEFIEKIERTEDDEDGKDIALSIVVPVYNECDNLDPLYEQLVAVLAELQQKYEMIFIDDGSYDGSLKVLKEIHEKDARVKIVSFRKNYGQTAALSAGFDYAQGDIIITLDGDLQNDPSDIPKLLDKIAEGYDLVNGWRADRKDKAISRKLPSLVANWLIAKITGVQLHDYGCTLKAYKKGVIKNIRLYGEMHRFIPAIVSWLGVNTVEIPVKHHPRVHGVSKYNISRTIRVVLDLICVKFLTSYMTRPMQYFGKLGVWIILPALFTAIIVGLGDIFLGFGISPTLIVLSAGLFVLIGIQFIGIGLMTEIVVRTYHEGQNKPIYVIKEIVE